MAVSQIEFAPPSEEYTGLSTDTKPTEDVEPGAIFTESDTSTRYSWDGIGWNRISNGELQLRLLWSINRHLEHIREAIASEGSD